VAGREGEDGKNDLVRSNPNPFVLFSGQKDHLLPIFHSPRQPFPKILTYPSKPLFSKQYSGLTIIEKTLNGDQAAMQELYQLHERYWFRVCLRYGRNRSEAQDIMQEGLVLIFRDLHQFDPEKGAFRSWSNRVLVNAALRFLKKHQWQLSFEDLESARNEPDFSETSLDKLSAKEITEVIQQLPSGYRMVFNMYVIEGYSHKEIAALLNISVGTSKSQLSKAKKMLRQKIEFLL
jgi:RNA polymerase sigma factor (sigma-70 family)